MACFEPTYEGWKRQSFIVGNEQYLVLSLPMRDGNLKSYEMLKTGLAF